MTVHFLFECCESWKQLNKLHHLTLSGLLKHGLHLVHILAQRAQSVLYSTPRVTLAKLHGALN